MQSRTSPPGRDDVWIVIAAYNEATRLPDTLRKLLAAGWGNVVVVDDGSADNTYELAAGFPVVRLRHPVNCGYGAALRTGAEFALKQGAEVIVTFDADGQHCPGEIEQVIGPIQSGSADVTIGSRFRGSYHGMPVHRWLILRLAAWFTRLTSGLRITDPHNGYRAFTASAARRLQLTQPRFAYASEFIAEIARLGLRFTEVPVTISYTEDTLQKGQQSLGAIRISADLLVARLLRN